MRILFVTAAYLPQSIGGVELHVRGIARALQASGHETLVFTRGSDPSRQEFFLERTSHDGVPVVRLDYKFSDCKNFSWIVKNPNVRARFEAVLDEWRPDVVHVHHLTCLSTDLVDAARERGIPVAMTLHDFWMGCPRGQRMTPELDLCHDIVLERCVPCLTKMWSGWFGVGRDGPGVPEAERHVRDLAQLRDYHAWILGLLKRIDQLITPSESSRQIFGRQGLPVESIRVVENGLDHAPYRENRPAAGAPRAAARPFRFGFIGSVLPTKGVHTLVEAFVENDRRDAELHVHGELLGWHEVTGYGERLRTLSHAAMDRVFFHGRYGIADVPGILAGLDALVVPSLWFEAFCLTLREGFLAGVPVIVSDHGAMREAIVNGDEALLFRPGDVSDLAAKMRRIQDEPELRRALRESKKRVRSVEDNAAELAEVYGAITKRTPAPLGGGR